MPAAAVKLAPVLLGTNGCRAMGGAQTHRVFDTDFMWVAPRAWCIRGPMVAFLVLPAAAVVATGGCITWGSRRPVGYAMLRRVSGCAGLGEVGVAGAHVSMLSRIRGVCFFLASDCAGTDTTFPTECRMLCVLAGLPEPSASVKQPKRASMVSTYMSGGNPTHAPLFLLS